MIFIDKLILNLGQLITNTRTMMRKREYICLKFVLIF